MNVDLTTEYLGLKLRNPVVVSACPLTESLDQLRGFEAAGAAAAVFPSLFEEQIVGEERNIDELHEFGTESFAEALDYMPELVGYNTGPDGYLQSLEQAKRAVDIPIIASLNGSSRGGWVKYARSMVSAGADALELNIMFIPDDVFVDSQEVEARYVDLLSAVREAVDIPLAVKVGPYFSSTANMARRFMLAGANGLVLFNRLLEPDIDLYELEVKPKLVLSHVEEFRLPLRWIAILRDQLDISLAATSGVHRPEQALKLLLAGADVTMVTTSIYRHGAGALTRIVEGIRDWLGNNDYESVAQMRGSMSKNNCPDADAYGRGNYMKAIVSYTGEWV
ncbi:Dihydroorotate dehydrogenase B (NAD(+)), catalytic subunit [Planctomycetes bacterium Pan216]|uniref:Dihydroorotate dehydrogenase B (NAD(+)), catalytic subunit n=1 Tax=Kolteria novifilia TaxID=2527975 RepID=A0A518AYC3_9BACT|nr:Dihydroorotate dehydrogenase B (NAD(+)), catalytic subunit [Planctomycetes bacterium Pan216]